MERIEIANEILRGFESGQSSIQSDIAKEKTTIFIEIKGVNYSMGRAELSDLLNSDDDKVQEIWHWIR